MYLVRNSRLKTQLLHVTRTGVVSGKFNPYLTNGFSHHYQLGESTFIFMGVRSDFYFLSDFSMKFLCANRIAPDGTPLFCLPMSHKRDARLK